MNVDVAARLKRATSRAKSDVANKLISMLLHDLSRQVSKETGLSVNSTEYGRMYAEFFGDKCPYCTKTLKDGSIAVEHLEGMNRRRAGLHIPGNVMIACSTCNREKRRDDQTSELTLSSTGWGSFLSHDGSGCATGCKSCLYWENIITQPNVRSEKLKVARERILSFQSQPAIERCIKMGLIIQKKSILLLEPFYREGQEFAENRIKELVHIITDESES